MAIREPYPDLNAILADVGKAGQRLSQMGASEGAAGNISVYIGWPIEPRSHFAKTEEIALPIATPELAGATFLVTGSGCRLRDLFDSPTSNLAMLVFNEGGQTASLYTGHQRVFERITSEFSSHFAVHRDQIRLTGVHFQAVIHAQPMHLTYLSHIARYRDQDYLNQHLMRWQPETIISLPRGLGIVPFLVPGSLELTTATLEKLRDHPVVVWSKHGVIARSAESAQRACDHIEYVETSARYEHLNLHCGQIAEGLSSEEIREIAAAFGVEQSLF